MLRITVAEPTVSLVVHLDGKLTGPWVEEARTAISTALTTNSLCINLQNLSFADDAGIALLRGYRRSLIPLIGGSPWIEQLLACEPHESSGR